MLGVERAWGPAFVRAALEANFEQDRAIDEALVLDEILGDLGLEGEAIRAEASSPEWKPRLRAQTDQAKALGIFGAPTFIASGELFWGNDRLESALRWMTRARAGREGR